MSRHFAFAAAGLALFFASCGDDAYPTARADDDYALEEMQLQPEDLPLGYERKDDGSFDNEGWSQAFSDDEPEAKQRQLDAQGRVRNHIAIYSWEDPSLVSLGKPVSFTAQSTLFVDVKAARESMKTLCGLLVSDDDQVREFHVPRIGDEGAGFFVDGDQDEVGLWVETNVCFRTGRLVHAISQNGLDGTQDIGGAISLAKKMLRRVDRAFAGEATPEATAESTGG